MLTGANQPGHRCGKYQSVCSWPETCTVSPGRQTRQNQCVKEMNSVTLKRPEWKETETSRGNDNVQSMGLLICHSEWMQQLHAILDCQKFRALCSALPVFLSIGLVCLKASNPSSGKADPPEPRFSVFPCLTNSYESLTLKGCIVIQPNTAYTSPGKGEMGKGSACAFCGLQL